MTLSLRPGQIESVVHVHDAWRAGTSRVLCVAPTGAGKRYMAVSWAQKAAAQRLDCLIVTNRRILVHQMSEELSRFHVDHGLISGEFDENRIPFVQVASIQSLRERYLKKDESRLPRAKIIIVDEAHQEPEWYERLFAVYPYCKIVGLTATPVGPKGMRLHGTLYDGFVETMLNSDLIAQGLLLPTKVLAPSEPDIAGVQINGGTEYNQAQLGRRIDSVTTFADVFSEWERYSDRQTVVFAPGIKYAHGLCGGIGSSVRSSFNGRGFRAAVIEAATRRKDRHRIFKEFEQGSIRVLVSVDVLREGFDAPVASCGIDLQPNNQLRTYWQKVGRIKRAYPGQTEAVWIDMAGNIWKHLHPDDDPPWRDLNSGETTKQLLERTKSSSGKATIRCPKCSTIRRQGPRCPSCGHEANPQELIRRIRMEDGRLVEVDAAKLQKQAKSADEIVATRWKSELYAGLAANKTMEQCKLSYRRRHGEWPPDGLPCMPRQGCIDWSRKVKSMVSRSDIEGSFDLWREQMKVN